MIEFVVYGEAVPQGSKVTIRDPKGRAIGQRDSAGAKGTNWSTEVRQVAGRMMADRALPLYEGALQLGVIFHRIRPKNHFSTSGILKGSAPRLPASTPDLTKVTRRIEDALKGIVWRDDSQVAHQSTWKIFGPRALADVCICRIDQPLPERFVNPFPSELPLGIAQPITASQLVQLRLDVGAGSALPIDAGR